MNNNFHKKLEENGYVVTLDKDNKDTIYVDIDGPKDTIYEKGKWTISIMFSKDYPYKSVLKYFQNREVPLKVRFPRAST